MRRFGLTQPAGCDHHAISFPHVHGSGIVMPVEIECVAPVANACGESPVWDPHTGALWWVDRHLRQGRLVGEPRLWRHAPGEGTTRSVPLDRFLGSIGLRQGGGFVAATADGFAFLDGESGCVESLPFRGPDRPRFAFNDGKCDRRGRFWAGSFDGTSYGPVGELFRLDPDGSMHRCAGDLTTPNGIAFSPDDRVLYLSDSRRSLLYAYDLDLARGRVAGRRIFASTLGTPARIDGATVDAEGNYWCAHIRDGHVACYDRGGVLLRRIAMPVEHPTMCVFGGPALDVLYVTSGRFLLDPGRAQEQPLAGALFAVRGLGAQGLPEPRFAG